MYEGTRQRNVTSAFNPSREALSKLVSKKPKQWDKHLDAIMFGLRTKKQMTTKLSPFQMMFGREARYPSEVPEDYQIDSSVEAFMGIEEMTEGVLKLDEVLQTALTHTAQVQKRMTRKEQKAQKVKFSVGNKVWRCNIQSQQRKGGKLDPNFLGPYTIKNIEGKNADLIDERGVIFPKINIDHLRLYYEEMPQIPHKIVSGRSPAATTASHVNVAASLPSSPVISKVSASPVAASISLTSLPTISRVASSHVTTSAYVTSSPTISRVTASAVAASTSLTSSHTISRVAASSSSSSVTSAPSISRVAASPTYSSVTSAPTTTATTVQHHLISSKSASVQSKALN
ncbi:hypothetical protein IRJ41_004000 [Triplophysa rosa]|uniref:Uncharacterized protein n=1 Tax=Triplophysa rosa TaxID=992332 RepID=A0A9W7X2G6_TRIRA|nr:hypothetical protein IRJ41_004000 [Triplophysa rosa]